MMTSVENQTQEEQHLLTVLANLIDQQKRFNELLLKLADRVAELASELASDRARLEVLTAKLGIVKGTKPD